MTPVIAACVPSATTPPGVLPIKKSKNPIDHHFLLDALMCFDPRHKSLPCGIAGSYRSDNPRHKHHKRFERLKKLCHGINERTDFRERFILLSQQEILRPQYYHK